MWPIWCFILIHFAAEQVAKGGIPLPADRTLCPLCLQQRANPSVMAVSGFVFCYTCIFKYASQVRVPSLAIFCYKLCCLFLILILIFFSWERNFRECALAFLMFRIGFFLFVLPVDSYYICFFHFSLSSSLIFFFNFLHGHSSSVVQLHWCRQQWTKSGGYFMMYKRHVSNLFGVFPTCNMMKSQFCGQCCQLKHSILPLGSWWVFVLTMVTVLKRLVVDHVLTRNGVKISRCAICRIQNSCNN